MISLSGVPIDWLGSLNHIRDGASSIFGKVRRLFICMQTNSGLCEVYSHAKLTKRLHSAAVTTDLYLCFGSNPVCVSIQSDCLVVTCLSVSSEAVDVNFDDDLSEPVRNWVLLKMDGCITSKYTNERSLARKAMRGKHLKTAGDQNPATVKTSVHKFLAVEGVCMVGHALHICRNK